MSVIRRHDRAEPARGVSFIRAWKNTSVAEAVVVAEYCGYIGSTISRSTPLPIMTVDDRRHRRIADLHAEAHWHIGQQPCKSFGLPARVVQQRRAGLRIPDALILGGRALGRNGRMNRH